MGTDASKVRELFIEELAQVHGGGPVEELLERLQIAELNPPWYTTMACCEEGNDGCCA